MMWRSRSVAILLVPFPGGDCNGQFLVQITGVDQSECPITRARVIVTDKERNPLGGGNL